MSVHVFIRIWVIDSPSEEVVEPIVGRYSTTRFGLVFREIDDQGEVAYEAARRWCCLDWKGPRSSTAEDSSN